MNSLKNGYWGEKLLLMCFKRYEREINVDMNKIKFKI